MGTIFFFLLKVDLLSHFALGRLLLQSIKKVERHAKNIWAKIGRQGYVIQSQK